MPGMDGFSLIENTKPIQPLTPIIVLTGRAPRRGNLKWPAENNFSKEVLAALSKTLSELKEAAA